MYLCAEQSEGFTGRVHCSWMCICELEKCIIWRGKWGECIVFGVCIWEPVERDDLTWQFPPGSAATLPNLHSCPSQLTTECREQK